MFRKLCILGAAAFLAIAEAATEMPRELTHHNKTSKTNTKSKNNKAKTKEVMLCLSNELDFENLPSYTIVFKGHGGGGGGHGGGGGGESGEVTKLNDEGGDNGDKGPYKIDQMGGAVYFWSPVYDCSDKFGTVSPRSHLVSSSDAPNHTALSSYYQPKLTIGHGSGRSCV